MAGCPWFAAVPEADGEGDTCGNAEPRSPVGWIPRPGAKPPGSSPGGIVPGNIPENVLPSPAFRVDEGSLDEFLLMSTVADANAEFDASAEVAVAVSVT